MRLMLNVVLAVLLLAPVALWAADQKPAANPGDAALEALIKETDAKEALEAKKLEPSPELRAAAQTYLKQIPADMQVQAVLKNMAEKVSPEKREEFLKIAKETIVVEKLNADAEHALASTFTADELKAMTEFFGSEKGRTIMTKMALYQQQLLPTVNEMVTKLMIRLQEAGILLGE